LVFKIKTDDSLSYTTSYSAIYCSLVVERKFHKRVKNINILVI